MTENQTTVANRPLLINGYLGFLTLLFFTIAVSVALLLPGFMVSETGTISITLALGATFLGELLAIAAALTLAQAWPQWKSLLGFQNFRFKTVGLGLGLGVVFFFGLIAIQLIAKAAGVEIGNSATSDMLAATGGVEKFLVLFVGVSILAPLIEEMVFRGWILGFILRGHGAEDAPLMSKAVLSGVLVSALGFAILHIQGISTPTDWMVILWTFFFAVASACLRFSTRSLYPSIAAHSFYNFLSALALAGVFLS